MVNRRLLWLAGIAVVWGFAILARLVQFQVLQHADLAAKARRRQESVVKIQAPRGSIFDRAGRPLALSVPGKSVYINPLKVDLASASDLLSRVLGMNRAELFQRLQEKYASHRGDFLVKRRVTPEEADLLAKQPVDYIDLREEKQRHYPNASLAAHALGSVDFEEKGDGGVEQALDKDLRGVAGTRRTVQDVKKRAIESQISEDARPGAPLTLTIDERLQYLAERELAAAVLAHNAISGSVVAMNPSNGDVLVLASYPAYDPNNPPATAADRVARQNHASSIPFEPGSVFKVITLSAALETTNLRPESLIDCHGGVLKLPGRVIGDSHRGLNGVIPMSEVLARSSNVGAVEIGRRVGQENLNEYVRRFGFGSRTGIELPAESKGRLRPLSQWGKTSWASISFGHEVSTTTVQLAQAASVIANGGLLVHPRLVLRKGDQPVPSQPPVRILKPETAITMREMMAGVVEHGTGKKAQIAGYSVGGKTGSATIFDFATKHYTHTYNGSFLGFAPLTNPAIVVVVTLNGTHGNAGFGGEAAAPVFRAVTAEALRVLDIPEDRPNEQPKPLLAKVVLEDAPPLDSGDGQPNILEDVDDEDAAAQAAEPGPKVPNFRGMTKREVLASASANGLKIKPAGIGVARVQQPRAGAPLRQGELIRVVFAR